jgi:hypothetical protein
MLCNGKHPARSLSALPERIDFLLESPTEAKQRRKQSAHSRPPRHSRRDRILREAPRARADNVGKAHVREQQRTDRSQALSQTHGTISPQTWHVHFVQVGVARVGVGRDLRWNTLCECQEHDIGEAACASPVELARATRHSKTMTRNDGPYPPHRTHTVVYSIVACRDTLPSIQSNTDTRVWRRMPDKRQGQSTLRKWGVDCAHNRRATWETNRQHLVQCSSGLEHGKFLRGMKTWLWLARARHKAGLVHQQEQANQQCAMQVDRHGVAWATRNIVRVVATSELLASRAQFSNAKVSHVDGRPHGTRLLWRNGTERVIAP